MSNLEMEYKKSQVVAESAYDFKRITKKNPYLVDVKITKKEEEFLYVYDTEQLVKLSELTITSLQDKYRLLLNALNLYDLYMELHIDLNPDNIYIDYNYNIKIAYRDIYSREDFVNSEKFNKEYLSLLGAVLQEKYNYTTYLESGVDLLGKNPLTKPYASLHSIEEIHTKLLENYQEEKRSAKFKSVQPIGN